MCSSATRLGGQAGSSARIENYPGFPAGISGQELTQRTYEQALRFEAEFVLVNEVTAADPSARSPFRLSLLDGTELRSRAVILATGVAYRLLEAPGVRELTGRGICYGSRVSEARSSSTVAAVFLLLCRLRSPAQVRRSDMQGPLVRGLRDARLPTRGQVLAR